MKSGIALILASAWVADLAMAQQTYDRPTTDSQMQQSFRQTPLNVNISQAQLQRLSKLIGTDVRDQRGEKMGEIRDFAIDPSRDQVTFAIMTVDGRTIPVPWQALNIDGGNVDAGAQPQFVSLNIDRERLRNAPTIRRDRAMMLADDEFTMQVHRHFGTKPVSMKMSSANATHDLNRSTEIRYRDSQLRDSSIDVDRDRPRHDAPWRDMSVDPHEDDFEVEHDTTVRSNRDADFRFDADGERVRVDSDRNRVRIDSDAGFDVDDSERIRIDDGRSSVRVQDDRDFDIEVRDRDIDRDRDLPQTYYYDREGNMRFYADDGFKSAEPDDATPGGYGGGIWGNESGRSGVTVTERDSRRVDREYTVRSSSRNVFLASDLMDADARDLRGNRLGEVEDILVSADSGQVAFVVVPGRSNQLHAVPLQVINLNADRTDNPVLTVRLDENRLRSAPSFRNDQWHVVLTNPRMMSDTYAFYGVQEPGFVYGFTEPQSSTDQFRDRNRDREFDTRERERFQRDRNTSTSSTDANTVIRNWPRASQRAAQDMMQRYGQPHGVTDDAIYWLDNGQWAHTIVYREEVQHDFPMPHSDVLEQAVYFQVPVDRFDDIARFDGSVICDRTKGLLIARCDSEAMNYAALNLAYDVATGRRTVDEARQMLAETARQHKQGQSTNLTEQLQFRPQSRSQAGDADRPFNRERLEQGRSDRQNSDRQNWDRQNSDRQNMNDSN